MRPAAGGWANDMELVSTTGLGAAPRKCGRRIAGRDACPRRSKVRSARNTPCGGIPYPASLLLLFPPNPLCWASAGALIRQTPHPSLPTVVESSLAPCFLLFPSETTSLGFAGGPGGWLDVANRVDGDDLFGRKIIDTIDPVQADEPLPVAPAEGHHDAAPP